MSASQRTLGGDPAGFSERGVVDGACTTALERGALRPFLAESGRRASRVPTLSGHSGNGKRPT